MQLKEDFNSILLNTKIIPTQRLNAEFKLLEHIKYNTQFEGMNNNKTGSKKNFMDFDGLVKESEELEQKFRRETSDRIERKILMEDLLENIDNYFKQKE